MTGQTASSQTKGKPFSDPFAENAQVHREGYRYDLDFSDDGTSSIHTPPSMPRALSDSPKKLSPLSCPSAEKSTK